MGYNKVMLAALKPMIIALINFQENLNFSESWMKESVGIVGAENNVEWTVEKTKLDEWAKEHSARILRVCRHAHQLRLERKISNVAANARHTREGWEAAKRGGRRSRGRRRGRLKRGSTAACEGT